MPSASTARPISASVPMLSSLCERTMPGSVAVTTSSAVPRLAIMSLNSDIDYVRLIGQACAAFGPAGPDCLREFITGLETIFWLLRKRLVDDLDQALRQSRRVGEDVDMRFIGD